MRINDKFDILKNSEEQKNQNLEKTEGLNQINLQQAKKWFFGPKYHLNFFCVFHTIDESIKWRAWLKNLDELLNMVSDFWQKLKGLTSSQVQL